MSLTVMESAPPPIPTPAVAPTNASFAEPILSTPAPSVAPAPAPPKKPLPPAKYSSEFREVILNVKAYFECESQLRAPLIPLNKVYKRVAAATGIGESTVYKILKESKLAEKMGAKVYLPKKRKRRGKIEFDNFDIEVIRQKVHEFYALKNESPTIGKLLSVLKQEINFKGGRETLRKLLKKNMISI